MIKERFSDHFINELEQLFTWRRDVRHFKPDPIPDEIMDQLLSFACKAPSVGLSEPWYFIKINRPELRQKIHNVFKKNNLEASRDYSSDNQKFYNSLKLSGMDDAPHHIAVFSERNPDQGKGLGRKTMPQTTAYSTVMAIYSFWLAARAYGIGVGWVSIITPTDIHQILEIPETLEFIAYLCVGYPQMIRDKPELEEKGWEKRNSQKNKWIIK